ncbi:MAG: RlmE family RNA methyltransferase [Alphaproteobacteria bacterium]|nr:MAG: RlmE family RNA methyltransferase [Alphaproteobacteria bacterium]
MSKGIRNSHVQLKHARRFKPSSQKWLQRQLDDVFVKKAKVDGYRSRAAYKLLEIQEKYKLFSSRSVVVDLGAAPGGWTQVLVSLVNPKKGSIVALDILPMDGFPGVTVLEGDFTTDETLGNLENVLAAQNLLHKGIDVVLSDMATPTMGHRQTDHMRIMGLAELALDFALKILRPGGHFAAKFFMGAGDGDFIALLKSHFRHVSCMKPQASRKESSELYVIARDRKEHVER